MRIYNDASEDSSSAVTPITWSHRSTYEWVKHNKSLSKLAIEMLSHIKHGTIKTSN